MTSAEKNGFKFPTTLARRLRTVIENNDNQALPNESAEGKGSEPILIALFTQPETYYLAYGKAAIRHNAVCH